MAADEAFELAGIPIHGAQAQIGRLVQENILYAALVKQLRRIHKPQTNRYSSYDCECNRKSQCPELAALSIVSSIK